MEQLNKFVSSRGLLRSCDVHNENPISSSADLGPSLPSLHSALKPHSSIYVCTDALERFALEIAPTIRTEYTLVSGDSDLKVDKHLLSRPGIAALVESKYLKFWYAQNLAVRHERLANLPIGLDYHTAWEKPGQWNIARQSPFAQELSLESILQESKPIEKRFGLAYCNWHFSIKHGDRRHCMDVIDKNLCFFEAHKLPRRATWQRQSEFIFTISPEGIGLDCHRTWESLLLGSIPIVKRSPICSLFEQLPVLVIDDWREVTKPLLESFVNDALKRPYNFSKLFLNYWQQKIRGNRFREPLNLMGLNAFRNLMWINRN